MCALITAQEFCYQLYLSNQLYDKSAESWRVLQGRYD